MTGFEVSVRVIPTNLHPVIPTNLHPVIPTKVGI